MKQYLESVRPMHQAFIEPTRAYADLIVENNGSLENLNLLLESVAAEVSRLRPGIADKSQAPV